MPLLPAKCPECGGNINIDPEQRLGVCEYCKQPFVVQEAIQNYNTTYNITNNNEIKTDVVNIYQQEEKDFIIRAGILEKYIGEHDEVIIPDSVKGIDKNAFSNSAIRKITFGSGISDSSSWGEGLLDSCKQLEEIILAPQLKEIGDGAFRGTQGIKSIVIPEGCVHIGSRAFESCEELETVFIASSVEYIGEYAFFNCPNLKSIQINNEETSYGGRILWNTLDNLKNGIVIGGGYSSFLEKINQKEQWERRERQKQLMEDIHKSFYRSKEQRRCPKCSSKLSFFGACTFSTCPNRNNKVFDSHGNLLDGRFGHYYDSNIEVGYLIVRKGNNYYRRDELGRGEDTLIGEVTE